VSGADPRAGQEAARLLAAAQDWLRTSAPHLAPLADDGAPCSCPVCRAVAGLREADPDAVGRWVDSAVTALGSLVSQAGDLATARVQVDDEVPRGDGPDDGATDQVDEPGEHVGEDDPRAAGPGQDGPRPRRVRRIPLDLSVEDTGGQDR
jgi:hypothetical protein